MKEMQEDFDYKSLVILMLVVFIIYHAIVMNRMLILYPMLPSRPDTAIAMDMTASAPSF